MDNVVRQYQHVIKWRNQVNSHQQDSMYKGTIDGTGPGSHKYYELPEDYYGWKRSQPKSRSPPRRRPPRARPAPSPPHPSPPRHRTLFSPLLLPQPASPAPSARYPLIPVAPPPSEPTPRAAPLARNPPFYSPEPEAPPVLFSSTPVNPYRYEPLYKPRPQPVFPPLVPVDRPRGSHRGVDLEGLYESNRPQFSVVPGYNAVGSILRSMKMREH